MENFVVYFYRNPLKKVFDNETVINIDTYHRQIIGIIETSRYPNERNYLINDYKLSPLEINQELFWAFLYNSKLFKSIIINVQFLFPLEDEESEEFNKALKNIDSLLIFKNKFVNDNEIIEITFRFNRKEYRVSSLCVLTIESEDNIKILSDNILSSPIPYLLGLKVIKAEVIEDAI